MQQADICYICLEGENTQDKFCNPGCQCSSSMHVHFKCLATFCEMNSTQRCSICKGLYMGITLVVPMVRGDCIWTITFYDGVPNGITTIRRRNTGVLVSENWYDNGQMVASHMYDASGSYIESELEYDSRGYVAQYWRYNSAGIVVDYEDYGADDRAAAATAELEEAMELAVL